MWGLEGGGGRTSLKVDCVCESTPMHSFPKSEEENNYGVFLSLFVYLLLAQPGEEFEWELNFEKTERGTIVKKIQNLQIISSSKLCFFLQRFFINSGERVNFL